MHNLDSGEGFTNSNGSKVDSDRRGFWELIQVELFFRLLYNKPPTLTESMNSWRVNLPYLSPDSQPDMETVPTLAFLVSSRITFVLTRFFQLLEDDAPGGDMLSRIEQLGEEVETLFQEWQMVGSLPASISYAVQLTRNRMSGFKRLKTTTFTGGCSLTWR